MNQRVVVGLTAGCFLLVTVGLLAGGAAGVGPNADGDGGHPLTTSEEFDATTYELTVYANGSVEWVIMESRPLRNETEVEQFESYAEEFASTDTRTVQNFRERARKMATAGGNVTGRDMEAVDFEKDAYVNTLGQTRGFVELSFVWTDMARVEDDRVVLGDVFRGGMYVAEGQRLVLRAAPDLAYLDVDPEPDSMAVEGDLAESDSVTWFGEREFAPERPRTELGPNSSAESAAATGPDDEPTDEEPPAGEDGDGGGDGGLMLAVLVLAFVVALGVAGGAAWYSGVLPGAGAGGAAAESQPGNARSDAGGEPDQPASNTGVPASELISDEDRVLSLLEENGGRMKQVKIVEETDWSKSKVSMLLSDMEEEGQISKLRVGRENIVSIAGQEPEAAGSPFDEE